MELLKLKKNLELNLNFECLNSNYYHLIFEYILQELINNFSH